jgi:hypothetical protein
MIFSQVLTAWVRLWTLVLMIFLPVPGLPQAPEAAPGTLVQLTDGATGRKIASLLLADGDTAVLTWTNSLFRLFVTEVYRARSGRLVQTDVTFALPGGGEPPTVRTEDVDDLYHTGGPFRATGLSRPMEKVIFRVGKIGAPMLAIGRRVVDFAAEVGFGGTIVLEAREAQREDPGE